MGGVSTFFMVSFKIRGHFKLISHLDPSPKMGDSFWVLVAHTLALLGYSRQKFRQGWLKHTFLKNFLEFLGLPLYPWKFSRKQSFTSGNSTKLCYNPWEFQNQKPRPMEIPHDCFWLGENSTLFYLIPGISICSSIPLEIPCPHYLDFFWNSP